jgi:hypothetical protein
MRELEQVTEPYQRFFQVSQPAERRTLAGLHGWLRDRFPLRRPDNRLTFEYVSYRLDDSPLALEVCRQLGCDFRRPLWMTLRLVLWSSQGAIEEVSEQEVGVGAVPALTAQGGLFLPELQPAGWAAVEAAVIEELDESLSHAQQHLCELDLGHAEAPRAIVNGDRPGPLR